MYIKFHIHHYFHIWHEKRQIKHHHKTIVAIWQTQNHIQSTHVHYTVNHSCMFRYRRQSYTMSCISQKTSTMFASPIPPSTMFGMALQVPLDLRTSVQNDLFCYHIIEHYPIYHVILHFDSVYMLHNLVILCPCPSLDISNGSITGWPTIFPYLMPKQGCLFIGLNNVIPACNITRYIIVVWRMGNT